MNYFLVTLVGAVARVSDLGQLTLFGDAVQRLGEIECTGYGAWRFGHRLVCDLHGISFKRPCGIAWAWTHLITFVMANKVFPNFFLIFF